MNRNEPEYNSQCNMEKQIFENILLDSCLAIFERIKNLETRQVELFGYQYVPNFHGSAEKTTLESF